MSTRKVLKEMLENCLGAAYQQEIRNRYQRNVEKDVYGVEEREYDAGIAELTILFSQEKKALLAEYEKTCSSLREYAAIYGFLAGICAGNHDITDVLVDATLRIGSRDYHELAAFLEEVYELSNVHDKNFVFTVSADKEELPESIFNFCTVI